MPTNLTSQPLWVAELGAPRAVRDGFAHMHAIIRRYGVDQNRTAELTGKVNETLIPKLEKLRTPDL